MHPPAIHGTVQFRSAIWLGSLHLCKVFVGSFRGGKRGGSRTAHLKAPAAEVAGEAAPAAALKPSPWNTTRSQQPGPHQAPPATTSRRNRGNPSVHPATDLDEAEPIEDEDGEEGIDPEAEGVHAEGDDMEQDDEDEEVSDMEAEEEEEKPMAGAMNAEGSGELVFEVDVVDALAGIPTSQPERWESNEASNPAAPPLFTPFPSYLPLPLPPPHTGMPISNLFKGYIYVSLHVFTLCTCFQPINKQTCPSPQPPAPSIPDRWN